MAPTRAPVRGIARSWAFEIVPAQNQAAVTRKAPTMLERGVERVFAVFVKQGRGAEWMPDTRTREKGRWAKLAADAKISHSSLAEPMPVAAILDAASADYTVARSTVLWSIPVRVTFCAF